MQALTAIVGRTGLWLSGYCIIKYSLTLFRRLIRKHLE
jgi:hypothetical protein